MFAGTASRAIARRLRRRGYRVITKPASFRVKDVTGPLVEGELDRAQEWADKLAAAYERATSTEVGNGRSN
jgi:hypothetical protein